MLDAGYLVLNAIPLIKPVSRIQHRNSSLSNILRCFARGHGFHPHRQESAQEQNTGAPNLSVSESFVENPGGKRHRDRRAKKLEGLGQRDSDFMDRDVIQNMGKRDTGHSGNDKNEVGLRARVDGRADFAKREREGQKQRRGNKADDAEAADRAELS